MAIRFLCFESHFDDDFCMSVACDMDINKMCSRGLDMCFIWKFYIMFFKPDTIFLLDLLSDCMFIESTEYFSILSFEYE